MPPSPTRQRSSLIPVTNLKATVGRACCTLIIFFPYLLIRVPDTGPSREWIRLGGGYDAIIVITGGRPLLRVAPLRTPLKIGISTGTTAGGAYLRIDFMAGAYHETKTPKNLKITTKKAETRSKDSEPAKTFFREVTPLLQLGLRVAANSSELRNGHIPRRSHHILPAL